MTLDTFFVMAMSIVTILHYFPQLNIFCGMAEAKMIPIAMAPAV